MKNEYKQTAAAKRFLLKKKEKDLTGEEKEYLSNVSRRFENMEKNFKDFPSTFRYLGKNPDYQELMKSHTGFATPEKLSKEGAKAAVGLGRTKDVIKFHNSIFGLGMAIAGQEKTMKKIEGLGQAALSFLNRTANKLVYKNVER